MRTLLLLLLFPITISAQEANFAGVTGNAEVSNCDLINASGMITKGENGEDINCASYTMAATIKNKKVEVLCKGKELCDSAKELIKELRPGDTLYINKIIGENIYGVAVKMQPIKVIVTRCDN